MKEDAIAKAIIHCFQSVNVADSNLEAANVVDCLDRIGRGLFAIASAIEDWRIQDKTPPLQQQQVQLHAVLPDGSARTTG